MNAMNEEDYMRAALEQARSTMKLHGSDIQTLTATFFSDFFPLMNKSKNNVIEFANGKYYIMGAEVYFTGSLAAHEAYLGDFSYIIGNYSQDITVVRSEHSGLATNSIDYLGACVFDSKPVAGFGAFVHLAKAAA